MGTLSPAARQAGAREEEEKKKKKKKIPREQYETILAELQTELVKMQAWVKEKGLKVAILFEGRDAAGKVISQIASTRTL